MFVSSLSQSNFLATKLIYVCNNIRRLDYVALIFSTMIESNVFLFNLMCDDLMNAHKLFDQIGLRDVASWSLLILAYARLGHIR